MYTLLINTATNQYSLAVMKDEGLVGECILPSGSTHFRNLMPSLDDLFGRVGLELQELDGLIVALGPGSFTGIRVGLAVVMGISHCLDMPAVGVSTLQALASQIPFVTEDICPLVTSRRGEVFTALFRWDSPGRLLRCKEDTSVKMSELGSTIEKKTIFVGNDLPHQGPALLQELGEKTLLAPANLWALRASSLGFEGLKRLEKGNVNSAGELVPIYLRETDIRTPKGA